MNILVPINSVEHIDGFIEGGASEFYIGFYDKAWVNKFGDFNDINRMSGIKENANSLSFQEVLILIESLKQKGIPLYIAFNASIYSKEQLEFMKDYFSQLKASGCDGVIVSTKEQCELASEIKLPTIISTIAGVYNSDIANYYKQLGVKRIILPRDLSIEEIYLIKTSVPELEYEVFMMRNGCVFSDSNCLGLDRKEICGICTSIKRVEHSYFLKVKDRKNIDKMEVNNQMYSKSFHQYACGLCSIYDFIKMGIRACKIVGRYDEYNYVLEDVKLVACNIEIAKQCVSRDEFLSNMILPKEGEKFCRQGFSCYYPEVRF